MTYVRETIVTTKNIDNTIKVSPLGIYIEKNTLKNVYNVIDEELRKIRL